MSKIWNIYNLIGNFDPVAYGGPDWFIVDLITRVV